MDSDPTAAKQDITLKLNDDLVRQARLYTCNLIETIECLLTNFVVGERVRQRGEDAAVNSVIDALNAFHAEHGLLSDEFSDL